MKHFDFHDVLLIFKVYMHDMFPEKMRKILQLLMLFRTFEMSQTANQPKFE